MKQQHGLPFDERGQLLIPRRRSITAEELVARQQAAQRPEQRTTPAYRPAARHNHGHYSGIQPEDEPYDDPYLQSGDFQEPTRQPTTIIRYPPQTQAQRKTQNIYLPAKPTRRLERTRWVGMALLVAGIGLFVMLVGWLLLSVIGSWWQTQLDDWHYGRPRTYQADAVVGHGDSLQHPSHFIAMNLNRQVLVIEIPGGNPTKARVYLGPTLIGDGQDLVPVTVSFQGGAHPGKPDLYLHIGDQAVVFLNNGSMFISPQQQH